MLQASNAFLHILGIKWYTIVGHCITTRTVVLGPQVTHKALYYKRYTFHGLLMLLVPRATIVDVSAPVAIGVTLHIIIVVLLSYQAHITWGIEKVGGVYHLNVHDVTRLSEAFIREVSTAHMCGSLAGIG